MPKKEMETKRIRMRNTKYDSETGVFEGYASPFGNVDSDGDVVEKGAYAKFLAGDWSRVKILALHNEEWLPIGKPLELREDDVGLYIKAQISDTSMGRDVRQLLKDGVLDELSIGYIALDFFMDDQGFRHLTEIELLEVSVVTWAANALAKVLDVKSRAAKSAGSPEMMLALAEQLEKTAAALRSQAGDAGGKEAHPGGSRKAARPSHRLAAEIKGAPRRRGSGRR